MPTLFRLDASIRAEGSTTRRLADRVRDAALAAGAELATTGRDIGAAPVSSTAWPASAAAGARPEEEWSADERGARSLAAALADELATADAYLFAVPLYNWGVSQHFKTWADVVMTDPRFLPRTTTIAGRPGVLVVARGGDYRAESPQAEWDHATSWMRRVLEDVWGLDLRVVEVHLTLAPVHEYMAHLRDDAADDLSRAVAEADVAGAQLAERLRRSGALDLQPAGAAEYR